MNQPVVIKGNKSGLIVHLDEELEFSQLKEKVEEKFETSSDFLGSAQIALAFEGRQLSEEEKYELMECIREHSQLDIVCLIDDDAQREAYFTKTLEEKLSSLQGDSGQFYKGTLRSGQVLEFETSIVILGDVNVGAQVVSSGNVIVLGKMLGTVYAGASGNENSFVVALQMNPTQIRIADIIARSPDKKEETELETKIAFAKEGNIYIEPLNRKVLDGISI